MGRSTWDRRHRGHRAGRPGGGGGGEVGGDDGLDALQPNSSITARPTGPHPRTIAASPWRMPALVDRVHADGQWFRQRRDPVVEPVRHLERDDVVQDHQLRVPAGVLVGVPDDVDAARRRRRAAKRPCHRPSCCCSPGPARSPRRRTRVPSRRFGRIESDRPQWAPAARLAATRRANAICTGPYFSMWRSEPQIPQARKSVRTNAWPDAPALGRGRRPHHRPIAHRGGSHRCERRRGLPPGSHGPSGSGERGDRVQDDLEAGLRVDATSAARTFGAGRSFSVPQVDHGHARACAGPPVSTTTCAARRAEQVGMGEGEHRAQVVDRRADEALVAA